MYYYLKGKLIHKADNLVVVDCNGVGYQVKASLTTVASIGEIGEIVTIYTYLSVREDAMELYGFCTPEEKNMFIHLISVSGVGPRMALAILSVTSVPKFALAVITEDTKTLTKASGVGPKLAKRVILELKDKLKKEDISFTSNADLAENDFEADSFGEAVSALIVLGYGTDDAKKALQGAEPSMDTESLVKYGLKRLMRG